MSGLRRIIRHPDAARSDHLRARLIAASLLDGPVSVEEEAWLAAHLEWCEGCQDAAAAFRTDRAALRTLPPIEPPRDLWAHTAAGLDREDARHGHRAPRRSAGPTPAGRRRRTASPRSGALLPVLALVLVLGLVGGTALSGLLAGPAAPSSAVGSGRPGPGPTPIAVAAGAAAWVTTDREGRYVLNAAGVSEVCPTGSADCAHLGSTSRTVFTSSKRPASVIVSRGGDQAIVFDEPDSVTGGSVSVLLLPIPFPTPDPTKRPTAAPSGATARPSEPAATPEPSGSPVANETPGATGAGEPTPIPPPTEPAPSAPASSEPSAPATSGPSAPAGSASPTASPSEAPVESPAPAASEGPSAVPSPASPSATPAPEASETPTPASPSETPAPEASETPASPSQTAASPATAAPSSATARTLAILDGVVVVGNTAAFSPDNHWFAFSARPADGNHGPDVYVWRVGDASGAQPVTDDHRSVFASWVANQLLVSGPDLAGSGADPATAAPVSRIVDPSSGRVKDLERAAMWAPVVDPSRHFVVYWSGRLVLDRATHTWRPDGGRIYLADWRAAAGTLETGTRARPERPTRLLASDDPIDAWEGRWDSDGLRLAVWIGSGGNQDVGRLSLLEVDAERGTIDHGTALLTDAPARAGFSMGEDRLVWAEPEGAGRDATRVLVLAWSGANAGQIRADPSQGDALVTVAR